MLKALLLLLIAMISIQYGASIAKGLFPLTGAAGATALRVSLSALILILVSRLWRYKTPKEYFGTLAIYGVSLGTMNILFYLSLQRIPLGIAVALEFAGPLAVAIASTKRIWDLLWAFLAGVGIYLIIPSSDASSTLDLVGVLLALAAGFFWGLYIVFGKRVSGKIPSSQASAIGMIFAALVTFPIGMWIDGARISFLEVLPMALMVAVLSSALPYSLEMRAMQSLSNKTFGVLMSLEPVVAIIVGFIFLNEHLSFEQNVAVCCIIAASAGSTLMSANENKKRPSS